MSLFMVLILGISSLLFAVDCEKYYRVKRGDSLWKIAKKYKVSVKYLKRLNPKLKRKKFLRPGERICVRERKIIYVKYKVKKGDTLITIAKKFGTDVKEIKKLNNLKTNAIRVGQVLKIPTTKKFLSKLKQKKEVKTQYIKYVVKRGDTLIDIAKKFGVSVKEIKKANGLKRNIIKAGQVLIIPVKDKSKFAKLIQKQKKERKGKFIKVRVTKTIIIKYKVRRGDSLIKIAKKFGTSVKAIKRLNRLKGNLIRAGQYLKIPVRRTFIERRYVKIAPKKIDILPARGKVVRTKRGILIYTDCGSPVRAVEDGRVIYSGDDLSAFGNVVIVEHKDFVTVYAYNSENLVKLGQRVKKGQTIARAGFKPDELKCAVHFEIRTKNGTLLNPLEYVKLK